VLEARAQLTEYFWFYNEERLHERLGYRTPHEVYFGTTSPLAPAAEAVVYDCKANGEAVFSRHTEKMAFGHQNG